MTLSNKRDLLTTSRFRKDIKTLQKPVQLEAFEIAKKLCLDLKDNSLKIKKLTGFDKIYRVVVFKDFRMIYTFTETEIILYRIAHRKEIYKNLEI
jgi:mRNA-degrading endonuclease RelE of RelBE toxin-antitoxin system